MPLPQPQIADRLAPYEKTEGNSAKEHSYFGFSLVLCRSLAIVYRDYQTKCERKTRRDM